MYAGTLTQPWNCKSPTYQAITSLQLNENEDAIIAILQLPDDSWLQVRSEIISVLERVMREEIRVDDLKKVREQLPTQVSLRYDAAREPDRYPDYS